MMDDLEKTWNVHAIMKTTGSEVFRLKYLHWRKNMEAQNKAASVSGTRTDEETVKLFLLLMDAQSWSKGARRLETALLYLLREEQPEDHMVKELYAEVASRTNCTWVAAERSLRYTIRKLWDSHPNLCSRLFYRSKERLECPSVSMFLILFYTANKRGTIREWVELSEAQSLSIYPRIGNIIFSFMIKPSVLFDWKQYRRLFLWDQAVFKICLKICFMEVM